MADKVTPAELFTRTVRSALKASENIADQDKKAAVLAEVAKALAMSGMVDSKRKQEMPEPEETVKEEAVEKEEVEEEVEEAEEEAEEETVWTEEMKKKYEDELEFLQQVVDEYDEEEVNDVIEAFSEGTLKTIDDVTPENIEALVAYINSLLEDEDE